MHQKDKGGLINNFLFRKKNKQTAYGYYEYKFQNVRAEQILAGGSKQRATCEMHGSI